jgi:DNA-binding GntR family transcriptional regulator
VRPMLLAPLLAPTTGWTSRTLAEITGRSQAAVARAWTQTYTSAASRLVDRIPAAGLRLVTAAVTPHNSVLVLTVDGPQDQACSGPFMRSPRRRPLQTLLAADLLASSRAVPKTSATAAADPLAVGVVRATRRLVQGTSPLYVVSRRPLGPPTAGRPDLLSEDVVQVVEDQVAWQGLLADLVRRCTRSTPTELVGAQHLVMEWARSDRPRFEWSAFEGAVAHARHSGTAPNDRVAASAPRSAGQALADNLLTVLLDRIAAGRLAGGDRVTASSLARAVHASRSQVRDALRIIAAGGLLNLEPHRGAVIPAPQTADVVETYAARRAIGSLIVRRAAHWTPGALDPVEQALSDLIETGRRGDSHATGEADLRFQDALARSTGMRVVPPMFCHLTAQLRMFIAVLGLHYTYSIPGMCRDDTALLEHIRARDEAGAARIWHKKIDDAATYMRTQLNIANAARRTRRRT